MRFKSFEEIIEYVRSTAAEDSESRIEAEVELFSRRGWEAYILFLVNLLLKLDLRKHFHVFWSMSAKDSYVICKAIGQDELCQKLIRSTKSSEILFNDALRLDIEVVGLKPLLNEDVFEVGNIIEGELKRTGLNYKEHIIPQENPDDGCQYIIVSNKTISVEEEKAVLRETDLGNEVDDILRKLLIIKFGYKNRL